MPLRIIIVTFSRYLLMDSVSLIRANVAFSLLETLFQNISKNKLHLHVLTHLQSSMSLFHQVQPEQITIYWTFKCVLIRYL